jgi:hypothetical protein
MSRYLELLFISIFGISINQNSKINKSNYFPFKLLLKIKDVYFPINTSAYSELNTFHFYLKIYILGLPKNCIQSAIWCMLRPCWIKFQFLPFLIKKQVIEIKFLMSRAGSWADLSLEKYPKYFHSASAVPPQ